MRKLIFLSALSLIVTCLNSCEAGKVSNASIETKDTVSMATISLHDTLSYFYGENEKCNISAEVEVSYPKLYVDNANTDVLQRLFAASVLDIPSDSISLATAFPSYVENLIYSYKEGVAEVVEGEQETDYEPMTDCVLRVKTYPVYNEAGYLSICKEETAVINNGTPAVRHFYYTFNLGKMSNVTVADLFADEYRNKVAELLKSELRAQMKVESDDELADMGYFNFDNLTPNDNFYFTESGITWNFLPMELSVLEEVQITLDRAMLEAVKD